MSTELETSYGGVVVRGGELLVITPAGKKVTGLPKGGMEAGETPEQVAAREVREETGVVANVISPLGDVRYTYRRGGGAGGQNRPLFPCGKSQGPAAPPHHQGDRSH